MYQKFVSCVAGTSFQTPIPTEIWAVRKKLLVDFKGGLLFRVGIARLVASSIPKHVPQVCAICRWYPTSDAISDENLGSMKKTALIIVLFLDNDEHEIE